MFGYITANRDQLTPKQLERYQSCYCGLCHCIGSRHGFFQRAALNYDMTFLILLLSSLYESEEQSSFSHCAVHPFRTNPRWQNDWTAYAADMNVALAYHNCMDDWHDDKAFKSLILANVFRSGARRVKESYPLQWSAIQLCMEQLQEIEAQDLQDPDAGANAFGALMGTIFSVKDDHWSPLLYQLGSALGRFIYLMDAVLDVEKDHASNSYNPLRTRWENGATRQSFLPVLKLLIGEATDALERLPLLQDLDLLRNILYSGVWCKFLAKEANTRKEVLPDV